MAVLVGMRRRIAGLSRQGAAAAGRAEHVSGLMDSAADGRWLWPAGRSAENAAAEGSCAPALAEALGLAPDADWAQFRERLASDRRGALDQALTALRQGGAPFDLT